MLNLSRTLAMALAMSAMQLSGAIIISSGPTNFAGDENLLFNAPGLNLVGLVVEGATNNTGFIIESRNAGESLTGNGGQARVEGTDGSFTAIIFVPKLANVTFATMVLNINANVDGSVQFTVTPPKPDRCLFSRSMSAATAITSSVLRRPWAPGSVPSAW